eukprot:TRINITY_DN3653_c0_g1_i1.p1 TRINITY_DN3653_c0_g1~~TRINITY_DN3653_c0_g1_i1.p1  ORF type:complete len:265 (+),score=40.52 TRINITY_DN3653_c0_g1_i1:36-797(+)
MAPVVGIETPHRSNSCAGVLKCSYRCLIFAFTILFSPAGSQRCDTNACHETWEEEADLDMVLESTESSFLQTFIEMHHHTAPAVELPPSKMVQSSPAKITEEKLQKGKSEEAGLPRPQQSVAEGAHMHQKEKRELENAGPVEHVESSGGSLRFVPKLFLDDFATWAKSEASTTKQQTPLLANDASWASFDSTQVFSSSATHLRIAVLMALIFIALLLPWVCVWGREILGADNSRLHIRHLVDQVLEPKVFATP